MQATANVLQHNCSKCDSEAWIKGIVRLSLSQLGYCSLRAARAAPRAAAVDPAPPEGSPPDFAGCSSSASECFPADFFFFWLAYSLCDQVGL